MPSLITPKLDDRTFQGIVDEAKSRISQYCPEWTDHNVSDPGVTLIELFAWMIESLLYRLNQVPQLHYIKFLQMFGITLDEPVPATTQVTFWLTKPLKQEVGSEAESLTYTIPVNTEVATTQTDTDRAVVFTTDIEAIVRAPRLEQVFARLTGSDNKLRYSELKNRNLELARGAAGEPIFAARENIIPLPGSALYFGFGEDISYHVIRIALEMRSAGGDNVNPLKPPYVWEVTTGEPEPKHWRVLGSDEVKDTTQALCSNGEIVLHLPKMGKYDAAGKLPSLFWVRVRIRELSPDEIEAGFVPYSSSPQLKSVAGVETMGVEPPVTQGRVVRDEVLGRSEGKPGQRFQLQSAPILRYGARRNVTLVMSQPGKPNEEWQEAESFAESKSSDRHFTLDRISGELRLGPAVRQPDGNLRCYGATPARDAILTIRQYRTGGGLEGNVMRGEINTLRNSIPFVDRVYNRNAAHGGMDAESLDSAMVKASNLIRTRERAITPDDFEFVANRVLQTKISRVKCIQPYPDDAEIAEIGNRVYVVVIARVDSPGRRLNRPDLTVSDADIAELKRRFEDHRPLTMHVDVSSPAFKFVAVHIVLMPAFDADRNEIERQLLARLYRFVNPIIGWTDGQGWPFGRKIRVLDIPNVWQDIPGVHFVQSVELYETDANGERTGEPVDEVSVLRYGVICSGRHSVDFLRSDAKELGSDGAAI